MSAKIAFLTAAVSRKAGGLYDAMRFLARSMAEQQESEVKVFGLADRFTALDLGGWGALKVSSFNTRGPSAFGYSPKLSKALYEYSPDVVHAHGLWMYPSVCSLRLHRTRNARVVISPHGMLDEWAIRNGALKKKLAGFAYEGNHLRAASCLHALCNSEAASFREYGLKNPICVIPNGVHLPSSRSAPVAGWRRLLPERAKVLLFLGRIHPKKGLAALIEGWHLAKASSMDSSLWHLVVAGWEDGKHQAELLSMVDALGISGSIHFVGPQFSEEKEATYRSSDAFVLSSFSEGLPMTVLEAWSYGLPVVITPECNLPEGFENNAAIRVDTTPIGISRGLESLFSTPPSELVKIGARGRMLAAERFAWDQSGKQMLEVYRWVLGGRDRPECVIVD